MHAVGGSCAIGGVCPHIVGGSRRKVNQLAYKVACAAAIGGVRRSNRRIGRGAVAHAPRQYRKTAVSRNRAATNRHTIAHLANLTGGYLRQTMLRGKYPLLAIYRAHTVGGIRPHIVGGTHFQTIHGTHKIAQPAAAVAVRVGQW